MEIKDKLTELITKWRNDSGFSDLDFVNEVIKIRNEEFTSSTLGGKK